MPSDVGRTWDDLVRRHWKGLWGSGRAADESRNALRAFFAAVQEELNRQRRVLEELRGEVHRGRAGPPEKLLEKAPAPPPKPTMAPSVLDSKQIEKLERALGHRFHNPRLLEEALAHPSFTHENLEIGLASNYRLAFLGDALLGFLIADVFHEGFREADQQVLTEMRKRIVSRPALARAAARLGVGPYLLLGRGEEQDGRGNRMILAETFEALVAAIYLDGGLDPARAFLLRVFGDDLRAPGAPRAAEPRRPEPHRRRRSRRR